MFDIIHPARRNLTAIRGYVRLGGLPDDPRTDPQDRSWFGPHDRLFVDEESEPVDFHVGPDHGVFAFIRLWDKADIDLMCSVVLGMGWRGGFGGPGCGTDLGEDEQQELFA